MKTAQIFSGAQFNRRTRCGCSVAVDENKSRRRGCGGLTAKPPTDLTGAPMRRCRAVAPYAALCRVFFIASRSNQAPHAVSDGLTIGGL